MAEENKVVEQEQEHVSENPAVTQDTEHVASSESEVKTTSDGIEYTIKDEEKNDVVHSVPPEAAKETSFEDLDPKIKEDLKKRLGEENITPHEHATEKSDGTISSIKTPEEIARTEGDGTDVSIDMSKIVMDKDGIPEFTFDDANRIKMSGLALTDFEFEIKQARNMIFAIRNELSDESQKAIEEENKKNIAALNEKIKELENNLSNSDKKEEDEKLIEDSKLTIEIYQDEIDHLPKYDPKVKLELEQRELNAKKIIATYQNVSRYDIGQLQNDGTIAGLISSTANMAFVQAFVDSIRKSKGEVSIEETEEIKTVRDKQKKIEAQYNCLHYLDESIKELDECELEFTIQHAKDLKNPENKHSEEVSKAIDFEKISNITNIVKKLSNPMIDEKESEKLSIEYNDIKTSLISIEDEDKELAEIKEQRAIESRFIDNIEKYTRATMQINQAYGMAMQKPLPKLLPKIDENTDYEELKTTLEEIKKEYVDPWEKISKEYEEYDDEIDDLRVKLVEPLKNYVRRHGLFASFINYAFSNSELRGYYGRSESLLEAQHVKVFGDKFYNLIRSRMSSETDEEYNKHKVNINAISMSFNNMIEYFVSLHDNTLDLDFASQYDPDSILKKFYTENKEFIDPYIDEYKDTISVLSHVLIHNLKFSSAYYKFVADLQTYIQDNEYKLAKLNEGKKIKNKYKFKTDIAFAYQFITSYVDFQKKASDIQDKVDAKRKEGNLENFDVWYKENLKSEELEATKRVINSFVHMLIGCNIVYAFDEFKDYFESKNDNKALSYDCTSHIFSEYILESGAFRNCPKDQTYKEYIKGRAKNIAFNSIDYSLQRDVDVETSRREVLIYVFGYATNCLRDILANICDTSDEKKEEKAEKKTEKKSNKKSHDELIRSYREKGKEKKKALGVYKTAVTEYRKIITETTDDNTYHVTGKNDIYNVKVFPSKDTKVIVRIERFAKDILDLNAKRIFDESIIKQDETISVRKAYIAAKKVSNDTLTNINEKWYYNQFVDGTFAKRDGVDLSTIDATTYTLSERCRNSVYECLKFAQTEIIKSAIKIIKNTGVDFDGKSIAVKNNCKFDIKYLKSNTPNITDGNLNFFKSGLWDVITFELNYDIVNEKK